MIYNVDRWLFLVVIPFIHGTIYWALAALFQLHQGSSWALQARWQVHWILGLYHVFGAQYAGSRVYRHVWHVLGLVSFFLIWRFVVRGHDIVECCLTGCGCCCSHSSDTTQVPRYVDVLPQDNAVFLARLAKIPRLVNHGDIDSNFAWILTCCILVLGIGIVLMFLKITIFARKGFGIWQICPYLINLVLLYFLKYRRSINCPHVFVVVLGW